MKIKNAIEFGINMLSEGFGNETDLGDKREITSNVYFLLSYLTQMSISELKSEQNKELSKNEIDTFHNWLARRLEMEPVQYITGETEFWSQPIYVGPGVLIPRQDTETLVSEINDHFKDKNKDHRFLDIACGSGCIGLSLLKIFPNSNVTFADKYDVPIMYTERNIKRLGFKDRATVIKSDMFNELPKNSKFDAIVSNPPYIPQDELKSISVQITLFEPIESLTAGIKGLDFYELFAAQAVKFLTPNGALFLEIGYNQCEDVTRILKEKGWKEVRAVKDLGGNHRVVIAKNPNVQ
jgi:release factor glutamine methyltransferase